MDSSAHVVAIRFAKEANRLERGLAKVLKEFRKGTDPARA